MPLILNDGTDSYLYGPGDLPVEQIDSEEKVLYLHHDQQGSTRMLTDASGTVQRTMSYDAYGNPAGSTGTATTPLGYDGQYTDADTGLIYLRARSYDPATAQFISVDPEVGNTHAPYSYADDNPLTFTDPTGLSIFDEIGEGLEDVATRYVGFVDGFTSPVLGGTAAIRGALGLNGGLETCSLEYQVANSIGQIDVGIEVGVAAGSAVGTGLGPAFSAIGRVGPVIRPLVAGGAGSILQKIAKKEPVTISSIGKGAVGGLAGELVTGFFPGTSSSAVSGATGAAVGLAW